MTATQRATEYHPSGEPVLTEADIALAESIARAEERQEFNDYWEARLEDGSSDRRHNL